MSFETSTIDRKNGNEEHEWRYADAQFERRVGNDTSSSIFHFIRLIYFFN